MTYQSPGWEFSESLLFDPAAVRQARLRRNQRELDARVIQSEILKVIEFTRDHNMWVDTLYTNWQLSPRDLEFEHRVANSTGELDHIQIRVRSRQREFRPAHTIKPIHEDPHARTIRWRITDAMREGPVDVEIHYCWLGGGLLTAEELEQLPPKERGPVRQDGFEFAAIRAPGPVAVAELIVLLPNEYRPDDDLVLAEEEGGNPDQTESAERARVLGHGHYALRIPYPPIGQGYRLKWKPPPEQNVNQLTANVLAAQEFVRITSAAHSADALLKAFCDRLENTELRKLATEVTLYAYQNRGKDRQVLIRIAGPRRTGEAETDGQTSPPQKVLLSVGDNQALVMALRWGPVSFRRGPDTESANDAQLGFMPDEVALFCLPIRFSQQVIPPPPWGVVRLAVLKSAESVTNQLDALLSPNNNRIWWNLSAATAALLSETFEKIAAEE